jgi:hypothetical protein
MPEFLRSCGHLLWKALIACPSLISQNWTAVGFSVVVACLAFWFEMREEFHALTTWRERISAMLKKRTVWIAIKSIAYGCVLLFAWSVVKTIYEDHLHSVENIRALTKERDDSRGERNSLRTENESLRRQVAQKPTVITKNVTADPPKQCWMAPHFGMPNSTIKGAATATAVILHCNYKIDAPFRVVVEFDRDFLPGGTTMPSAGMMSGNTGTQGRIYGAEIGMPSLPADNLFILTVYGETDQYPRPVRFAIQPVH